MVSVMNILELELVHSMFLLFLLFIFFFFLSFSPFFPFPVHRNVSAFPPFFFSFFMGRSKNFSIQTVIKLPSFLVLFSCFCFFFCFFLLLALFFQHFFFLLTHFIFRVDTPIPSPLEILRSGFSADKKSYDSSKKHSFFA